MKKQNKNTKQKKTQSTPTSKANSEEQFPGYPKYPSNEDIMTRGERIDMDLESSAVQTHPAGKVIDQVPIERITEDREKQSPSDLTKDDFQALASDEIESVGDDEALADRVWPVDFAGDDLDIPGSEEDDAQEAIGSEDEENNSYSLGSDRHTDLEEDRT
ncbi:MAG TPA: hypothetical protein VJ184_10400 [Chryseolinea sp.]|nr:hypothetical protein [Chryseolinea sp.]